MAPRNQPDRVVEPVVQRHRIAYAKRGPLRFASHRDFQRALERAIRRAGIPIAFSAGFSPHPKISYANAAPTGIASEAEYVEIGLTRRVEPSQLLEALDKALPTGMDVLDVVEARTSDFAERLQASVWGIEIFDATLEAVDAAVAALLAAEDAQVTRMTKQGLRTFDVRHAILDLRSSVDAHSSPECAILRLVVRHTIPAVRPDDVLQALASVGSLTTATPSRVTRWSQGPLSSDARDVGDPLAADRV
jgi:radical SAM-linked protein